MHDETRHGLIWKAHGVQHDGPVDRVRRHHDVFANEMHVGWPKCLKLRQTIGVNAHLILQIARETDVVNEASNQTKVT